MWSKSDIIKLYGYFAVYIKINTILADLISSPYAFLINTLENEESIEF